MPSVFLVLFRWRLRKSGN